MINNPKPNPLTRCTKLAPVQNKIKSAMVVAVMLKKMTIYFTGTNSIKVTSLRVPNLIGGPNVPEPTDTYICDLPKR